MKRFGLALAFLALLASCTAKPAATGSATPFPTKDDLALVNGQRLSIALFLSIREQIPSHDPSLAYELGALALVAQTDALARDRKISLLTAVDLARFALGDLSLDRARASLELYYGSPATGKITQSAVMSELQGLLARAVIIRNPQVLSELAPAVAGR